MLLIGEVAERAGVATAAIRCYEELGLIEASRPRIRPETLRTLRAQPPPAITASREAGLSREEIRWLLDSQAEGTDEWRKLVDAKIAQVRARIERLKTIEGTLRDSLECGCRA